MAGEGAKEGVFAGLARRLKRGLAGLAWAEESDERDDLVLRLRGNIAIRGFGDRSVGEGERISAFREQEPVVARDGFRQR